MGAAKVTAGRIPYRVFGWMVQWFLSLECEWGPIQQYLQWLLYAEARKAHVPFYYCWAELHTFESFLQREVERREKQKPGWSKEDRRKAREAYDAHLLGNVSVLL